MRNRLLTLSCALLFLSCAVFAQSAATSASNQNQKLLDASQQVPSISADRGDCSASFTVLDGSGKPVYMASIRALVKWGLVHKTDLTVQTNYYGKAQFTGLPAYSKKPIIFEVTGNNQIRSVAYDPGAKCKADFTVELK